MRPLNRRFSPALLLSLSVILVTLRLMSSPNMRQTFYGELIFKFRLPLFFSLAVLLLLAFVSYYEYHGFGPQGGVIRRGDNHPKIALTFDDGPHPEFTPKILDILKDKQVKATFFMVGRHIEKYPEVALRVSREGHEIGNHTYSHRDLVPTTKKRLVEEVRKTDLIIRRVLGVKTRLFRPPRGIYSNAVRRVIVDDLGFTIVLWTISAADWSGLPASRLIKRVLYYAHNGGIILFHDSGGLLRSEGANRGHTVQALPMIIDELRERGFEIVSLTKLLAHKKAEELIEETAGVI